TQPNQRCHPRRAARARAREAREGDPGAAIGVMQQGKNSASTSRPVETLHLGPLPLARAWGARSAGDDIVGALRCSPKEKSAGSFRLPALSHPFTHTTWRSVWTISTRSACAAITASMSL